MARTTSAASKDKLAKGGSSVVSATVPAKVRDELENIRWGERLTMSEIVLKAILDSLAARGIDVDSLLTAEDAPAAEAK